MNHLRKAGGKRNNLWCQPMADNVDEGIEGLGTRAKAYKMSADSVCVNTK